MMAGGGSESNSSSSWSQVPYGFFVEKAHNDTITVLSFNDNSTFIPNYFRDLGAVEVFNKTIQNHSMEQILAALSQSSGVFLKGGSQNNYITAWRNTEVAEAIFEIWQAGGVIGGTSAGAMVIGEFISTRGSLSAENLGDPFNSFNVIEKDFLDVLPGTVIDTHYQERGRQGRLLGMMGRVYADQGNIPMGIGIDDRTAVMIDPDGNVRIAGSGSVQIFFADEDTEMFAAFREPLRASHLQMRQFVAGYVWNKHSDTIVERPDNEIVVPARELPFLSNLRFRNTHWSATVLNSIAQTESHPSWLLIYRDTETSDLFQNVQNHTRFYRYTVDDLNTLPSLLPGITRVFVALNTRDFRDFVMEAPEEFSTLLANGLPAELLTDHLPLTGEHIIRNLNTSSNAAFHGNFQVAEGANLSPGVQFIGDIFEMVQSGGLTYSPFAENRGTALTWLMAKNRAHLSIGTTGTTELEFSQQSIFHRSDWRVASRDYETPLVIVDARDGYETAETTYQRHAASLTRARVHVVPSKYRFDLTTGEQAVSAEPPAHGYDIPEMISLRGAFPNPFNPATQLHVKLAEMGSVRLHVYDVTGRILVQDERTFSAGEHLWTLDLSGYATGVYFVRMQFGSHIAHTQITLLK